MVARVGTEMGRVGGAVDARSQWERFFDGFRGVAALTYQKKFGRCGSF
jgi:hypothetical protein